MTLAHGGVPPVSAGVAGCGVVGLAASAGVGGSVVAAAAAASAAVGSSAPAVDGVGLAASAGVGGSVASAPNCEAESARAFSLFWFCRWRRLLDGSVFAQMTLALLCLVCAQVQVDDGDGGTPRAGSCAARVYRRLCGGVSVAVFAG